MHPLAQLINSQQRHTRQQIARTPRFRVDEVREPTEETEAEVVATAPTRLGRIRVAISWATGNHPAR